MVQNFYITKIGLKIHLDDLNQDIVEHHFGHLCYHVGGSSSLMEQLAKAGCKTLLDDFKQPEPEAKKTKGGN